MPYNQDLARRVYAALADQPELTERHMFGGLAFMLRGNMCCGVLGDDLMARIGPGQYEEALALPHARAMDFTGRPMRNMVFVSAAGLEDDADLEAWVARCLAFVSTLPPK